VRRTVARGSGIVQFGGFSPELQTLMNLSALPDPSAPQLVPPTMPGLVTEVGVSSARVLDDLRAMISFLGEIVVAMLWSLAHPRRMRWRDVFILPHNVGRY